MGRRVKREDLKAVVDGIAHTEVVSAGLQTHACRAIELVWPVAFAAKREQVVQLLAVKPLQPVVLPVGDDHVASLEALALPRRLRWPNAFIITIVAITIVLETRGRVGVLVKGVNNHRPRAFELAISAAGIACADLERAATAVLIAVAVAVAGHCLLS